MRLDHVSYATQVEHLADTVQRLGAAIGATFVDGGLHPRFGTRNFILPLAGGSYVEVVSALDHPAAETAPFGRAVRARAQAGGGWMGWVVAVSDMAAVEARLGRPAVPGHRIRPDGFDLRWRQVGVLDTMADPQLPYFIAWDVDAQHHPSAGGHDVSISELEIAGSRRRIAKWLGEPASHPLDEVSVIWLPTDSSGGPGLVAVTLDTPRGRVRID
ncbi:MAG: VOC family protein [Candidatus Nanopelagicales bacterium]